MWYVIILTTFNSIILVIFALIVGFGLYLDYKKKGYLKKNANKKTNTTKNDPRNNS